MKRAAAIGVAVAALSAFPARATELELGIDSGLTWDDQVVTAGGQIRDDFIWRIGPRIRMVDELGSVKWHLHYRPTFEKYFEFSDADDWDHDLFGTVSWSLSRRTTVQLSERYIDTSSITSTFTETGGPDPFVESILQVGTNRVRYNQLSASLDHQPTGRQTIGLNLGRFDTRYSNALESEVTSLNVSWLYALSALSRAGLSLSAVQQDVGGPKPVYFYNGSLQWVHRFDRTTNLTAAAGPAWVDRPKREFPDTLPGRARFPLLRTTDGFRLIRASSCEPADGGLFVLSATCDPYPPEDLFFESQQSLVELLLQTLDAPLIGDEPEQDPAITYFANVRLTKQWKDVTGSLSYNRGASTTTQFGGQVTDTLTLGVAWVPTARRWRGNLWLSYGRREFPGGGFVPEVLVRSATVQGNSDLAEVVGFRLEEVDRNQTVNTYRVGVYLAYQLTPRIHTYLNASWQRDEFDFDSEIARAIVRSQDRTRVIIGVAYAMDPINLPF